MAGEGRIGQGISIQVPRPDAFALKNSGLHAFLYADVGTELNGSPLTILSVLARLGNDPWVQAASWAAMPRAAAIDDLAQSIAQMPLVPTALTNSRDIAARLVQFLPPNSRRVIPVKVGGATPSAEMANWSSITMIWCGVAVWMALSALMTPKPAPNVIAPITQPIAIQGSTASAPLPLPQHAAIAPTVPAFRSQERASER